MKVKLKLIFLLIDIIFPDLHILRTLRDQVCDVTKRHLGVTVGTQFSMAPSFKFEKNVATFPRFQFVF